MECISIVVLAYDCERAIGTCLSSVIQNVPPNRYELICVVNGSKDGALGVVNRFTQKKDDLIVLDGSWLDDGKASLRGVGVATGDAVMVIRGTEQLSGSMLAHAQKAWIRGKQVYYSKEARSKKRDLARKAERVARALGRRLCR